MNADKSAIRRAASLILSRETASGWQVLMGQRGAKAAFMPSKFVFPGGAVDPDDAAPAEPSTAAERYFDLASLSPLRSEEDAGLALARAALRELREETGLALDPNRAPLRYVFRAITPPGAPRRFDAHFFLADARAVIGDPEDFSAASDELSHLQWLGLAEARALDLPFITEVVLSEITHLLTGGEQDGVPFFDNSETRPQFRRLF